MKIDYSNNKKIYFKDLKVGDVFVEASSSDEPHVYLKIIEDEKYMAVNLVKNWLVEKTNYFLLNTPLKVVDAELIIK